MKRYSYLMVLGVCAMAMTAQANLVFFDNFNNENSGVGKLNYASFAQWSVSDGTVDLIGNGYYDFLKGNGLYVDMDGSTGNAGKMMTSVVINLAPGTYKLQFDLAGNQRNAAQESVAVQVNLGTLVNETYSLAQNAPFTTFSKTFTVLAATSASISFEGAGGDNIGMLLDNVSLSAVPAPAAALLALIGLPIIGWVKRRFA